MRRRTTAAALTTLVALAAVGATEAATISVSSAITSGATLSVALNGSAPSFGVTLSGADQTTTYTLPLSVVDARGSGNGWHLTLTSTTFSDGGSTTGHVFATNASTVTAATNGCGTGSTCTAATNSTYSGSYPLAVPAAASPPTAVSFYGAAANTGMGTVSVNSTVSVAVPANLFAGTFTSTLSVAVAAGP